jgi:hypothetical protein
MPTLRSPNGLLSVTWRNLEDNEAEKFARLGSNQARIAVLREWAEAAIRADNKDPAEYQKIIAESETVSGIVDRSYWSACMLKRLDAIQAGLAIFERGADAELTRKIALNIINDALLLASEFHEQTIADNERSIFTGTRNARNLRESSSVANASRHKERTREWSRWNAAAAKIWERHPKLSRQSVAAQIKTRLQLVEDEGTIAKRLKKPRKAH